MTLWVIEWRHHGDRGWHPLNSCENRRWKFARRLTDKRRDHPHAEWRIAKYVRAPEKTNVSAQREKVTR